MLILSLPQGELLNLLKLSMRVEKETNMSVP